MAKLKSRSGLHTATARLEKMHREFRKAKSAGRASGTRANKAKGKPLARVRRVALRGGLYSYIKAV